MWRSWGKSSPRRRIHNNNNNSSAATTTTPTFGCKSFKDIQNLCSSDDDSYAANHHHNEENQSQQLQQQPPSPHRKASVFHRVRTAKSIIRQWSPKPEDQTTTTAKADYNHHPQPTPTLPPSESQSESESHSQLQPPQITDLTSQPNLEPPPDIPHQQQQQPQIFLPGTESKIVVYYTSLRVIRPTFEAYKTVQSILSGFRVTIDERDLSLDSKLKDELCIILGCTKEELTVPKVFVGGRYVGGAEEVKQMHEVGELKRLVEGLGLVDGGEKGGVCEMCGGYRFVVCNECSGSRKVYLEKGGKSGGFRTCNICNENGLIRCPDCFSSPPVIQSMTSPCDSTIKVEG